MDQHVHLFGCLTPAQALDLAAGHAVDWARLAGRWRDAGLPVPDFATLASRHHGGDATAAEELAAALDGGPAGFAAFQARYELVAVCSRWASCDHRQWNAALGDEIDHVIAQTARRGPAEVRVLLPATASRTWVQAALERLCAACTRHGLHLAPSLPRQDPLRHWAAVAAAAGQHACLTGVDLCGVEDEPSAHAPLAAAVAAWNRESGPRRLALLIHVGEQLRTVQPLTALRRVADASALRADRLGHALAARLDPEAWPPVPLWERSDERRLRLEWLLGNASALGLDAERLRRDLAALAGRDPASQLAAEPTDPGLLRAAQALVLGAIRSAGQVIEVCPTSNRVVSGVPVERQGIALLTASGVPWTVGSDDPGVLGTDLETERRLALNSFEL